MAPGTSEPTAGQRAQIYVYFGLLILLVALASPAGAIIDTGTTFILKNQLHAKKAEVSNYRLIIGLPFYFAFLMGFVRDRWNPLGLRDRGYLILFAPITAIIYLFLAFRPVSVVTYATGVLVAILCFRLVAVAYEGLMSLIGQEELMPGRLSTLWNVVASVPGAIAAFGAGWMSENLRPREIFLTLTALALALGAFGLWKPRAIFEHAYDRPQAAKGLLWADVGRLLRTRAIYPAVAIFFLWNFAPAGSTALQFFLTNNLHMSDSSFADFNGIFALCGIPTMLLYGYLCKRVALNKLLFWGTISAIPQWMPIMFGGSPNLVLWMAVPISLMGGFASVAYFDLMVRSCPAGLQGTLMALAFGFAAVAVRGSDRLGTWIFDQGGSHGFLWCALATTAVYALILPVLLFVPKQLTVTRDGEEVAAAS